MIWRCPDCETLNSENKCVVCGRNKPELSNNEQTSLKNVSVENHKNPQEQSEFKKPSQCNNINQEKIDHQQNQSVANDNVYTKSFTAVIVMLVIVIILLIVAAFLLIKGVKDDKNDATSTADISTTVQNKDSAVFEEKAETTLIYEEHNLVSETEINSDVIVTNSFSSDKRAEETEGLSTIVPGMETDDNRNDFVKMPSLLGKDYTEAIRILNTMGLSYKVTYSDKKYDDIGENCVFSQKPASGNEVNQDSVVELGISNYKTTTTQKPITESTVTSASQTTTKLSTTNTKNVTEKHTNASTVNSVEVKEVYTVYFHVHEDVIPVDVIKGDDAVPPSVKSNTEYKFIGWDGDYQNVTENRYVFALFETVETTTTETTTTIDTTALQVGYDGDITLLLSFNTYSLDIFNVPIEGTTWEDYYWTSSNEVCVQIFSGILQTYYEGETTLTLTYINNPSIVATTKFRVVSKIN